MTMANKKLHDAFHATTKPINSGVEMAMNLRKYARGKVCMVRIPGVCNHDTATTVLAHLGGAGMGMKHPDFSGGAWCCSDCHDVADGRVKPPEWIPIGSKNLGVYSLFFEGINRTQQELLKTANKHGVTLAEAIEEWARGLEL